MSTESHCIVTGFANLLCPCAPVPCHTKIKHLGVVIVEDIHWMSQSHINSTLTNVYPNITLVAPKIGITTETGFGPKAFMLRLCSPASHIALLSGVHPHR